MFPVDISTAVLIYLSVTLLGVIFIWVRFERSGSVELFCGIHETMQGLIVVAPSPHFALVGADGSFAIPAVPPGKYQLVAYTRSGAQARQPIEVGPEGPAAISLTLAGR